MATRGEPVCVEDIERIAQEVLPRNALDYYRSGANEEVTLKDNRDAFRSLNDETNLSGGNVTNLHKASGSPEIKYLFRPRFMTDVSQRDLRTSILGHHISFPVCISPTAMNKMAHPEGEAASARACGKAGIGFSLSTIATTSMEDLAREAPNTLKFFQVYIYRDRNITRQLLKRAENAGFKVLLLTVDTPFFGKRLADDRNKFKLPSHLKMANFEALSVQGSGVNESKKKSGLNEYAQSLFDDTLTWKDLAWLKTVTRLPVVVKGILTAEDAVLAVENGADGILVSNHGARQLDYVAATIDVLPEVVKAVRGRCEVYLDGGVRTGTDVLKAVALGAKAVFIGRPAVYGLAYDGENGVTKVLNILKEEFSCAMALSACGKAGIGFALSINATTSIEELAREASNTLKFFQVYIFRDRSITCQLLKRAENAGFKVLLLTVDTPFAGKKLADDRNKFKLPSHLKRANYEALSVQGLGVNESKKKFSRVYTESWFDDTLTWKDLAWLKTITRLPVVVKGILTAEDAVLAVENGADGILVSNHGARQLDYVTATIDALPEVMKAVKGRCEVYMDGGVRTGTDILKAVALGAKAVFIGRPAVYGLAYDGENGVTKVLNILKEEFSSAMALSGCSRISDITPKLIVHESFYKSKL